jgi:D-proline reductase (dithiol) PrdB
MEPIRYVETLNAHYAAAGHPPYQWSVNDTAPLHRLHKPLPECTVTLLTSGGISLCSMPAFDPLARNDHRVDAIQRSVAATDFQIHDAYYDHTDANRDINCQFPIDRLRELARSGEIGAVAARFWSGFMGRTYNRSKLMQESAPAFAAQLREDRVDILIAVPA